MPQEADAGRGQLYAGCVPGEQRGAYDVFQSLE